MKALFVVLLLGFGPAYAGCSDTEIQKAIKLTERGITSSEVCLSSGECVKFDNWMNEDHSIIRTTSNCLSSPKSKLEKKYKTKVLALMLNLGKIKEILQFLEK